MKKLIFAFLLTLLPLLTFAQTPVRSPYLEQKVMADGDFPNPPVTGYYTTYVRTDDQLYLFDSLGNEYCLTCGGVSDDDQELTLVGNILTLEDGGTVDLSLYLDNTDTQLIKTDIEGMGFVDGAHTTDTDTNLTKTDIEGFGFVDGAHTIDTDTNTQLSKTDIETMGFVDGAHTINTDTDTNLTKPDIEGMGFVDGSHTINTDTQLSKPDILNMGFVDGAHAIDTDTNTQLTDAQVRAAALSEGFVTGAHTIDDQTISLSGNIISLERGTNDIDLAPYLDNINNFVDGITVTGTTTKTITLTRTGLSDLTANFSDLSGAGGDGNDFLDAVTESGGILTFNVTGQVNPTFDLDAFLATKNYSTGAHTTDTNTQLSDAQVATAATNEGFVTGAHTTNTDNQTLDQSQLNGTNLELSLSGDGEATKSIDLSSLGGSGLFVADPNGYTTTYTAGTDHVGFGVPSYASSNLTYAFMGDNGTSMISFGGRSIYAWENGVKSNFDFQANLVFFDSDLRITGGNIFDTNDDTPILFGDAIKLYGRNQTQIDALPGIVNGSLIYNSTTDSFQGYENGAWTNLTDANVPSNYVRVSDYGTTFADVNAALVAAGPTPVVVDESITITDEIKIDSDQTLIILPEIVLTITDAFPTLGAVISNLNASDSNISIYGGGTINATAVTTKQLSGIFFDTVDNGLISDITFEDVGTVAGIENGAINLLNSTNTTVEKTTSYGSTKQGILAVGGSHNKFLYNTTFDHNDSGISVSFSPYSQVSYHTNYNTGKSNASGMSLNSTNMIVTHNTSYNNAGTSPDNGNGITLGHIGAPADNSFVAYNTIYGNEAKGIWLQTGDNVTIQNNIISTNGVGSIGLNSGGIGVNGTVTNAKLIDNTLDGNRYGYSLSSGSTGTIIKGGVAINSTTRSVRDDGQYTIIDGLDIGATFDILKGANAIEPLYKNLIVDDESYYIQRADAAPVATKFTDSQLRIWPLTQTDGDAWAGLSLSTSATATGYGWTAGTNRTGGGRGPFQIFSHFNSDAGTLGFNIDHSSLDVDMYGNVDIPTGKEYRINGVSITAGGTGTTEKATSVETIAALKALNDAFVGVVFAQGYWAVGDNEINGYRYDAAVTTGDNGGTIIKSDILTGSWIMEPKLIYSPRDFGGGDRSETNAIVNTTAALNAMMADPTVKHIYIPYGEEYAFTDPLISSEKHWECQGLLRYQGAMTAGIVAMTVRTSTTNDDSKWNSAQQIIRLKVGGANSTSDQWAWTEPVDAQTTKIGYTNWSEATSLVGLKMDNGDNGNYFISVNGFDTGFLFKAEHNGQSQCNITFGSLEDNRIGVYIINQDSNWANESKFFGGDITQSSNVGQGVSRYGVIVGDPNATGTIGEQVVNNIIWEGLSAELNYTGAQNGNVNGEALQVVLRAAQNTHFTHLRNEFSGPIDVRITDELNAGGGQNKQNVVIFDYEGFGYEDLSLLGDNEIYGTDGARTAVWDKIVDFNPTVDLIETASGITANAPFTFQDAFADTRTNSTTEGGISTDGLSFTSGHSIGVQINTEVIKKFLIRKKSTTSRLYLKMFDAAGAELTDSPQRVRTNANVLTGRLGAIGAFGDAFYEPTNDIAQMNITLSDDVKSISILIGNSGSTPIIETFSVYSFDGTAEVMYPQALNPIQLKATSSNLTASRNVAVTDVGNILDCTTTSTLTITLDFDEMAIDDFIYLESDNSTFTITGATGVTINGTSAGSVVINDGTGFQGALMRKDGTNTYKIFGAN